MPVGEGPVEALERLQGELARREATEQQLRAENQQLVDNQRSLEEAFQEFAELFEWSPLPCVTLDQGGMVRRANAAAMELLGRDIVGLTLRHRVEPADRRRLLDFVTDLRKYVGPLSCEIALSSVDGPPKPFCISARRIHGSDCPAIVTFTDLTTRNQALAEQKRLQNNEKEAKAATEARDQFIAMLSHELRTPLTPVMAAVSAALRSDEAPPPLKKMFTMIARNIEAERRLIDDLLDTSRIVHGKLRVNAIPADLHTVVEEAVDLMASDAERKHLTVVVDLASERSWVKGDGGRLRQVFWNLLQNAVKFTPEGGRIAIHSWRREGRVVVEVTDSGLGMEAETLQRLFVAFQQAPFSRGGEMPSRGGLGLGLAISRGIVELHHGQIHAASPGLGKGSRFLVELPSIEAPVTRVGSPRAGAARLLTPPATQALCAERRILLVEDDPDTAEILAELLRSEGFQIAVATSVAAALQQDVAQVDLVLSDIGLADGSGLDLMRALRAKKNVTGIALSGYGTESDILASKQAGFSAHLVKPVTLDKLVAAIRRTALPVQSPL